MFCTVLWIGKSVRMFQQDERSSPMRVWLESRLKDLLVLYRVSNEVRIYALNGRLQRSFGSQVCSFYIGPSSFTWSTENPPSLVVSQCNINRISSCGLVRFWGTRGTCGWTQARIQRTSGSWLCSRTVFARSLDWRSFAMHRAHMSESLICWEWRQPTRWPDRADASVSTCRTSSWKPFTSGIILVFPCR